MNNGETSSTRDLRNGDRAPVAETSTPSSESFADRLEEEISLGGGEWNVPEEYSGSIGRTMFDLPTSKDNTVTILLPRDGIGSVPSQSLVRIKSMSKEYGGDGRQYLGAVVQGPFAEPDGLRADAPIVVTTSVRGPVFTPRFHGRAQVELIGEEIEGTTVPPRFRPLPNSPVFVLDQSETSERLHLDGDVILGTAIGYDQMTVGLPAGRKDVLFRHVGILGTTGGGKSTTVSGLVSKLSRAGVAVVIFDTEGEYTQMMEVTDDQQMIAALHRRGLAPETLSNVGIYHLIGRETSNAGYRDNKQFCLEYSNLSPHAVIEILELNDAQEDRFMKAHDIARQMIMQLGIYPKTAQERAELMELDELERGFPRMTLREMYDVVRACADTVAGTEDETPLGSPEFRDNRDTLEKMVKGPKLPGNFFSWRKVQGSLSKLLRLGIFDRKECGLPDYEAMTRPGRVSIIDLSDTDSPAINNLVISEILRGLREQQEENYKASEKGAPIRRVMIVIEEAHEFLSDKRIKQMPVLFDQVARIARRGRKRWLGLTFVSQLPQHLPNEVLGLINNYVLHKISDYNVIGRLKNSIGGIDQGLWDRLPNLAPGQAIVTAASMTRPLLVAIDPTACKLRMTQ
ncbi:MAG TPA: ATP-binding protein [Blastocatellia bacterium]|nr:ATP-binding protein [Blastocatellia bacterium]